MNSIRKWLYKPKKSDTSLLAQFYFVDEDLNLVASELDSFDGRKDPERCSMLVNQLRVCQDKVLTVIQKIMEDAIPTHRANRDFRVKFPDDVLQDSLSGQLWFGAECLAAGSSILNREVESASMRPLARALTKNLDSLRNVLREQCLKTVNEYTDRIREALIIFDKLFAEFELSYVSAMVPVKTMKEYDMLQEVTVLFSETVQRALKVGLLTQEMLDDYDPALMFTIPRLAIVCGLLVYPEGPLNPDMDPTNMTEMFRPFQTLLFKIRELLYTLNNEEFSTLEKSLCSSEEPDMVKPKMGGTGLETGLDNLQIDQGFDEEGEGIVPINLMDSNILMLTPPSRSPRTPVNVDSEFNGLNALSPSTTIIEGGFRFASSSSNLNLMEPEEGLPALNKSESQDSGLHSENISTSDTVTVDAVPVLISPGHEGASAAVDVQSSSRNVSLKRSPDSNRRLVQSKNIESIVETVNEGDGLDSKILCDNSTHGDNIGVNINTAEQHCVNGCKSETAYVSTVRHMCQDLVNEIVENALQLHNGAIGNSCDTDVLNNQPVNGTMNTKTSVTENMCSNSNSAEIDHDDVVGNEGVGLSRQFSWQINIQLASQNLPMLEAGRPERSVDGGSISSDSTLSDQGAHECVSDFVIETLTNMATVTDSGTNVIKDVSTTTSKCLSADTTRDGALNPNISNNSDSRVSKKDQNSANNHSGTCTTDSQPPIKRNSSSGLGETSHTIPKPHLMSKALRQRGKVKRDSRGSLEHINCKTGPQPSTSVDPLDLPTLRALRDEDSSSYSSCQSTSSECDCDKDCTCAESETSSCNSENNDEEEIALAIQAAELASRNEARSKFRSSSDLIHRLFVCIAGVADQLQTNYASDLRHILKCVFELNSTNSDEPEIIPQPAEPSSENVDNTEIENLSNDSSNDRPTSRVSGGGSNNTRQGQRSNNDEIISEPINRQPSSPRRIFDEPPEWEPDALVERCTSCKTPFTFVRRRHHCRNCGKIFCGKCSSTTVPLPQYGHQMPVRVCHKCFLYQIAHFTMQ